MIRYFAPIAAVVAALVAAATAQAVGPFDPTFGRAGKFTIGIGEGANVAGMAFDPAGGFVVAGQGDAGEYELRRFSPAGRLDQDFGSNHRSFFPLDTPGFGYTPNALVARPGGGWLTAGTVGGASVVAHRSDGSLDTTFGQGGFAKGPFPLETTPVPTAITTQSDGRILVAGFVPYTDRSDLFIERMTPSGALDSTWGSGGVVMLKPPGTGEICGEQRRAGIYGLVARPDGTVMLAGTRGRRDRVGAVPFVARLRTDGTFDSTYGRGGVASLPSPAGDAAVRGAVRSGANGFVLGLQVGSVCQEARARPFRFAATKVADDGTVDRSYGSGGTTVVRFPTHVRLQSMAKLAGGRVALVGGFGEFRESEIAVARLTANGKLDRRFGGGRTCGEIVGGEQDAGPTAALGLPGPRLLVGGGTQSDSESWEFAMYRSSFTPGGVECLWPDAIPPGKIAKQVRLHAILGQRGQVRLLVRGAKERRFHSRCLGTGGPGDVVAIWDGRIGGRSVPKGSYAVQLELRGPRNKLLGRSYVQSVTFTRIPQGPRRSC